MIQGRPKRPPRRPARGSAEAGDAADWGVLPSSSAKNEARCSICGANRPEKASIHCVLEMKSSSAGAGMTSSTRTVKMGLFLLTARSISRETKPEPLLASDSTRMSVRDRSKLLMISSP